MPSSTSQTECVRKRKAGQRAKANPECLMRRPVPAFPIHPEGYDPKAADAKPVKKSNP